MGITAGLGIAYRKAPLSPTQVSPIEIEQTTSIRDSAHNRDIRVLIHRNARQFARVFAEM